MRGGGPLRAGIEKTGNGKATKLYSIEHPLLEHYTSDGYCAALEQLIKKLNPTYVIFPHTYQVRDFAPALATRFGFAEMSAAATERLLAVTDTHLSV